VPTLNGTDQEAFTAYRKKSFWFLVSTYVKAREVIAHDPSVNLALKSSKIIIPFILFHMSGVTKKLHDYVSISMQSGISITDIE